MAEEHKPPVHEEHMSRFLKLADAVSFGMGTPTNIFFWILAVAIWVLLGVTIPELFVRGHFLPSWFTSSEWNFPLNTVTTLAELYIGFLVAAAANRAERKLKHLLETMKLTLDKVEKLNSKQNEILEKLVDYQKKEIKTESSILHELEDRIEES